MTAIEQITSLATVIQLAVAPVFLLAGIAGLLSVMSGRLGRIIDRARVVERRVLKLDEGDELVLSQRELKTLWRRAAFINWAIVFCTAAGLLVCMLIASLFIAELLLINMTQVIAALFVLALFALIIALSLFLVEVQLATRTIRAGWEILSD
jgi:amino acid transporter